MQVPVLLMRHVFVKAEPAFTDVLSGMVTSATNEALFVQSGAFVGLASGVDVSVGATSTTSVAAGVSVAGASVAVGATHLGFGWRGGFRGSLRSAIGKDQCRQRNDNEQFLVHLLPPLIIQWFHPFFTMVRFYFPSKHHHL